MKGRHVVHLISLLAIHPAVAQGAELNFDVGASLRYESNIFRRSSDPIDDYGFEISPHAAIHQADERYEYRVDYRPTYRQFSQKTNVDDVDHDFSGKFAYVVTPRLMATLGNHLRYTTNVFSSTALDDPSTTPDESGVIDRRAKDLRNTARLGIQYALSPRTRADFSIAHDHFDPDRDPRSRRVGIETLDVSGNMSYRLDRWNRFGVGGSATFQFLEALIDTPASRSDIFNVFVLYVLQLDPGTTLSLQGGPAFISSTQESPDRSIPNQPFFPVNTNSDGSIEIPVAEDGFGADTPCLTGAKVDGLPVYVAEICGFSPPPPPPVGDLLADGIRAFNAVGQTLSFDPLKGPPPAVSSSELTFFALASLEHRWSEHLNSIFSYRRSESDSAGEGGTTIRDRVSFATAWQASQRWHFALRAIWRNRRSVTTRHQTFFVIDKDDTTFVPIALVRFTGDLVSQTLDQDIREQAWAVGLDGNRRLTRRLFAELRFGYERITDESSNISADNYLVNLGFRYQFDPYRLWN